MTEFIRTFHPIGQGAFYSEKHIFSNETSCTIVYDCGSETFNKTILQKKINASLFKSKSSNNIDILFISHFHQDHINGIKYLNPRIIIIPMLSDDDIIMLKVFNTILGAKYDIDFASDPRSFFPNSKIIKVEPTDDNLTSETDVSTLNDLLDGANEETINSGKHILLNHQQLSWVYIPFNYNFKGKKDIFKKEIAAQGLIFEKLNEPSYITKEAAKIRKATKKMKGGPNEQSLIVYSGPCNEGNFIDIYMPNIKSCIHFHNRNWESGCLYLGDSTITDDLLQQLYNKIGKYEKSLGTIQIPHHGSRDSYSELIIQKYSNPFQQYSPQKINFIISCGILNRHGHPSDYVVEHLLSHGYLLNIVTEQPFSILIQKGFY